MLAEIFQTNTRTSAKHQKNHFLSQNCLHMIFKPQKKISGRFQIINIAENQTKKIMKNQKQSKITMSKKYLILIIKFWQNTQKHCAILILSQKTNNQIMSFVIYLGNYWSLINFNFMRFFSMILLHFNKLWQ